MADRSFPSAGSFLVALVAYLLAAGAAMSAAPPERDIWYSISDGTQQYGSMHVVVRRMDDGNFEYTVASHLKVELFGMRQEYMTTTTAMVTPDLSLLRMESVAQGMSGEAQVRGDVTDDGVMIESQRDGRTFKSTFSFDDDLGLDLDLTMSDRLHRIAREMSESAIAPDVPFSRRVRVLSAESGEPTEVIVRLLQRGADGASTWTLEPEDHEWSRSTFHLDGDGIMVEQILTVPPMHIVRTTREEAMQFDFRPFPDRELLVFPMGREVPAARRLQHIDVKLSWTDIALEEFQLEDSRQKLLSITERDNRYTATVRIMRPGNVRADTDLPVQAEMFESQLAGTRFIEPGDARIAAIAREIVGDETSARAAVEAICQWVIGYIQPAMVAETLSGTQVLERRTGKCSEYTTLFASLARAAGVPTRIALGQRRFPGVDGDTWGGHMWNEVFVGEWIPVDASANEVGGSTDLLKFIHSDTVMGTQPLRWKLTRSLAVSVFDFELASGAGKEDRQAGLRDGTYTSAEFGVRFDLPDKRWTDACTTIAHSLATSKYCSTSRSKWAACKDTGSDSRARRAPNTPFRFASRRSSRSAANRACSSTSSRQRSCMTGI